MLSAYPACFFKDDDGYSVVFPDLNYLATCGRTVDEAFAMAIDVLAGYLFTGKKDGDAIPAPSDMKDIDIAAVAKEIDEVKPQESFVNIVAVDVNEYAKKHFGKAVKKTLSIPAWLNDLAVAEGINFSQALQDALRSRLGV